jgi:hypothetical protein
MQAGSKVSCCGGGTNARVSGRVVLDDRSRVSQHNEVGSQKARMQETIIQLPAH